MASLHSTISKSIEIHNQNKKAPSKIEVASLQATINGIVNTNWTLTDDFEFMFTNTKFDVTRFVIKKDATTIFSEHTMNCEVPALQSGENDVVSGGERRMTVKMYEAYRFNAKFRDSDSLALRNFFSKIWMAQQYEYFDDIKSEIIISNNGTQLFKSSNILITSVSPVQFGHDATAIAEFDVSFMSNTYSDSSATNFGSAEYVKKFMGDETNDGFCEDDMGNIIDC